MTEMSPARSEPVVPRDLVNRVVAYFNPVRVLMFGSRARGEATADSDTDLLVILDDDAPAHHATLQAGWEARRGYDEPADVVPVRRSAYERRAKIVGTLAYEVSLDGVLVYERD
jgi:predicted nucleotidyltransferase